MKRLLLPLSDVLAFAACATGGGGGGGGMAYTDCFTDYCVDYDDSGLQRLYLRTPGATPTGRSDVTTAAGRGGTQVVTRNPGTTAAASARMSPIPSARTSGGVGGRRP